MRRTDMDVEREAGAIYGIEKVCFSEPWTLETVSYQLKSGNVIYNIAYDNDVPIGFVLGTDIAGEAELYRIAVLPEFRRRGYGKALLSGFISECEGRGEERVFLEVRSKNVPAVALYEQAGYRKIAVRKGYYGDDDAVVMELIIKKEC